MILLSTFNGENYLRAQLQSLLVQTHTNWVLIWRDDGSSDATTAILAEFAETIGVDRCVAVSEPRGRIWPTASFMALLTAAVPILGPGDCIAFADQDDVWQPEKLARGLAALATSDLHGPALYCARLVVVDAQLKPLAQTSVSQTGCGFPASLTQNIATGCTIMLNRPAARLLANSVPPSASPHDWWSYLLVTAAGGHVIVDAKAVALYRQHRGNYIGIHPSWVRRALAALRRGPRPFMNVVRQHVDALAAQSDLLSRSSRGVVLQLHTALNGGLRRKFDVLRLPGLRRQNRIETLLFRLWFLIG